MGQLLAESDTQLQSWKTQILEVRSTLGRGTEFAIAIPIQAKATCKGAIG